MTKCREIMKRDVECLRVSDPAVNAARKMRDQNVGFLRVCDGHMRVLGTVTDRDIAIRLVADQRPASTTVEHIMTREIVACQPDDDLSYAAELMAQHWKSRILCTVDDGRTGHQPFRYREV